MKKQKVRDKFIVTVDSLDQEGRGVSRREGKVVFIEGALPGEEVEYERIRNKQAFESGIATQIFKESSLRVAPRCPYFGMADGSCGGCAMQHLEPRAQVAVKQKVLMDSLKHIGRVKPLRILPPIFGPEWHYRHRARLSVKDVLKKNTVLVGFHEKRSSFIADMKSCKILPKKVSDLLVPLRDLISSLKLRQKIPQIEIAVAGEHTALVLRVLETPSQEDETKLRDFQRQYGVEFWYQPKGPDTVFPMDPENLNNLKLVHSETGVTTVFKPTDFTQVNHALNDVMITRALRLLKLRTTDKVADFFCGLGNFTLPIATKSAKVFGIEGSEQLVKRAEASAVANGLADKASFRERNLFTWTLEDWTALWKEMGGIDKVLIDPPRDGAQALCTSLAETSERPERIVYVSCSPATLARDCNILVNEGDWVLKAAGIMNMFPHTGHVESIALFEQGSSEELELCKIKKAEKPEESVEEESKPDNEGNPSE